MFKLCLLLVVLLCSVVSAVCIDEYSINDFPPGFIFGAGTSAYQVEGAANEDGRSPSVWDTYAHEGNACGATGYVAVDQYHKYKEDVRLMAETGLDAYRFSISWSRIIPLGRGPVNPKGLKYYNNLINELISHGIQPHVSLYNYDHPQALEDEYGGWISRKMVKDFTAYADVCFREFGDRISFWATVNEPNVLAQGGYDQGITPPKRCSPPFGFNCSRGNSSYEPYLAAHHMLLAHASSVRLYRKNFQGKQGGVIGLTLNTFWLLPATNLTKDAVAVERALDFNIGWFVKPLISGDYPKVMKEIVGSRLPALTVNESNLVKGSFDFIGVIHYACVYVKDNTNSWQWKYRDFMADMGVEFVFSQGNEIPADLPVTPWALRYTLEYFKQTYGNPPIYIHENGQKTKRNSTLEDTSRVVKYLHAYIGALADAIRNGSNVKGYFMWSLLDLFELLDGYESAYGLFYVDLDDPELRRQPKLSAHWYSNLLKGKIVSIDGIVELQKNFLSLPQTHFVQ